MHELVVMLTATMSESAAVERFVDSWIAFDSSNVPIAVVVPDSDSRFFADALSGRAEVIAEGTLPTSSLSARDSLLEGDPARGQVVMLAVGEMHHARHYLWIDSHAVMLREFRIDDYFAAPGMPYLFLSEHTEARVDPDSFSALWASRDAQLAGARRALGLPGAPPRTCGSVGIMSAEQLAGLRDFWESRQLTYEGAMRICPDALAWYAFWLEREGLGDAREREPIFKDLRFASQRLDFELKRESASDLARGFAGVFLDRKVDALETYSSSRSRLIGERVDLTTLSKALCTRGLRRAPRVQRLIARVRSQG